MPSSAELPHITPRPPTSGEKLDKDAIGYDFTHPLMICDPYGMAQIRRDPRDRFRRRCVATLERCLGLDRKRLSFGLYGDIFPWKKIQREEELAEHFNLGVALREWARAAPRGRLGIDHTFDLLHRWGYLHTLDLHCDWDRRPFVIEVQSLEKTVAIVKSQIFKQTHYFRMETPAGEEIGYIDAIAPRHIDQCSRVRTPAARLIGTITLTRPSSEAIDAPLPLFEAEVHTRIREDEDAGLPAFALREQQSSSARFTARLIDSGRASPIGFLDDHIDSGKLTTHCEIDVPLDWRLAVGATTVFADLARLRRDGWPDRPQDETEDYFQDMTQELGTPRQKSK